MPSERNDVFSILQEGGLGFFGKKRFFSSPAFRRNARAAGGSTQIGAPGIQGALPTACGGMPQVAVHQGAKGCRGHVQGRPGSTMTTGRGYRHVGNADVDGNEGRSTERTMR